MKLSDTTTSILENFSRINGGIVISPGQEVTTISPVGNLLACATVGEEFPVQVCIYNLTEFLSIKGLFPDANLSIDDRKIQLINKDGGGATIVQSQPNIINNLNGKKIPQAPALAEFVLSNKILQTIPKMQLTLPHVAIISDGSKVSLKILDLKNPSSTVLEYVVGDSDEKFEAHILSESFSKVLKTDSEYRVSVTKSFTKLTNEGLPLSYWVSNESSSKL